MFIETIKYHRLHYRNLNKYIWYDRNNYINDFNISPYILIEKCHS